MKYFKSLAIFSCIVAFNITIQTSWLDIFCCCASAETRRKKSSTPKTTAPNSGNSTSRKNNSKQNSLDDNNDRYKTLQAYINSEDSNPPQARFIHNQPEQDFQEATKQNTSINNHDQYENHSPYINSKLNNSPQENSILENSNFSQERSINSQVKQHTQEVIDYNRPSAASTKVSSRDKNIFIQQSNDLILELPTTLKLQYSSTRENSFDQQLSHNYRDSLKSNENLTSNNKPAEATSNRSVDNPNQASLLPHIPVVNSSSNLAQKDQDNSIQKPVAPSTQSNGNHVSSTEMKRLNIASSCSSTPQDTGWNNKTRRAKSSESSKSESPQDYNF